MKYKIKTNHKKKSLIKESEQLYQIKAEPFLKWAGGKGQLIPQFEKYFLDDFNKYIEPFVGGGAVYFHLYSLEKLRNKDVILIDSNKDLINCYNVIKKDIDKLISVLTNGKYKNNENTFYKIRADEPSGSIERAARLIYLNKTCYNGLYRVNSKGKFNAPFGFYKNPSICVEVQRLLETMLI